MGKFLLLLLLIISAIVGGVYYFYGNNFSSNKNAPVKSTIDISSQEFTKGGTIPIRFTCNGDNVNPPLIFDRVPGDARSLVLVVDDPDAGAAPFNHWLVFNMSPATTNIEEGKIPAGLEGTNDFGELKYMGPCPTGSHKYYFRVYAMDKILELEEGVKRADLDSAMSGHIIAKGEFFGVYSH